MRFMFMVKCDADYEAGKPPSPALMAAMGKLSEEGIKNGTLLDQGGLLPSRAGALVRADGGELTVIDGPFTEAKELIGGYAIMQAKSKAEAIQMGKDFMKLHVDVLGPSYKGEVEIRQMMDFGPPSS